MQCIFSKNINIKKIFSLLGTLLIVGSVSLSTSVNSYADDGLEDLDNEKIGEAFIWGAAQGSIGAAIGTMISPGAGTVGGAALGAVIGGTVAAVGEAAREIVTPHNNNN